MPVAAHASARHGRRGPCPALASRRPKYAPNGIASHVMPKSQLGPRG